jgi:hypothetical protein
LASSPALNEGKPLNQAKRNSFPEKQTAPGQNAGFQPHKEAFDMKVNERIGPEYGTSKNCVGSRMPPRTPWAHEYHYRAKNDQCGQAKKN